MEAMDLDVVRAVRASVSIPVAIKVSPYYSAFANFAASCVDADPIAPGQAIHPFSEMEKALVSHPAFAGWYGESSEPVVASGDELEGLASRLHARRVFRSAAPGNHYLLAVYERE